MAVILTSAPQSSGVARLVAASGGAPPTVLRGTYPMTLRHRLAVALLPALLLVACSAATVSEETAGSGVLVSPTAVTLSAGAQHGFTAEVTAAVSQAVIWSVREGASGGSVSASGLFTAPAATGLVHVVATSVADPTASGAAVVTVTAAPAITVQVTPAAVTLGQGAMQSFTAQVSGTTSQDVTWSIQEGAAGGTISAAGLYVAPATTGLVHVVATSVAAPAASGVALVTVEVPSATDPAGLATADRYTRWDPGIPGGIPGYATVHTTIDAATYGNGTTDAAAAINGAITAAGAVAASTGTPQVVFLPAGTYLASLTIRVNQNNVVLRGAGPDLTRIVSTASAASALTIGGRFNYQAAVNVTADAPKGSTALTVADASSFAVGDVVEIDQQDGPAVSTGEGHFWNGYVWMGDGHYTKRQPGTADANGPLSTGLPWGGSGTWLQIVNFNAQSTGPWRSVTQSVEVTGKSGNVLTLRDPLHVDFTLARVPQVFKLVSSKANAAVDNLGTHHAGAEELAVAGGTNNNISLVNAAHCWLRHVESDGELIAGDPSHPGMTGISVALTRAYRCVVRDSYVHHARSIVNGGGAYGIAIQSGSSANLVENNVCVWLNKPIVMNVSGGGNVVAYNFVDNAMINGTAWQENAIDGCHQAYSHSDLFEGNSAPNIGSDSTHGSAGWHLFFRNHAFGRNSMPYNVGGGVTGLPTQNLRAAGVDALSREHTFLGNVLVAVDVGGGTIYEKTGTNHPSGPAPVYRLGDNGNGGAGGSWDTGQAAAFTYRNGNWDNLSGAVLWDPGTTRRDLPSSLYLTAKPAFFGDLAWPWLDPLGATAAERIKVLPAQARYAAGTPNLLAP